MFLKAARISFAELRSVVHRYFRSGRNGLSVALEVESCRGVVGID
jgi:hypothetical protein